MKYCFLLSKEDLGLAKAEALALVPGKNELAGNLLIVDRKAADIKGTAKRLAYTNKTYRFLFDTDKKNLKKDMKSYSWNKIYKKSFAIRIDGNVGAKEKDLAGFVWDKVKNPKVDLEFPQTVIELLEFGGRIFACLLIYRSGKEFLKRKAHLRPEMFPSSLNPKLARAMVNLTGIKIGEILLDPFCGSGGILIEAGLMRLKTIGYDIDERMIRMAEKNLSNYKVKRYSLSVGDATKMGAKVDYVVTDLPYGKNTKNLKLDRLYNGFINNLKQILKEKAVVGFPDFYDYKTLIKKHGFKIENEFSYYLHKSLSKRIVVMSRD